MENESIVETRLAALLRWDAAMLVAIRRWEAGGLALAMRALTRAGDTPGWIVHGCVLYALLPGGPAIVPGLAVAAILATATSQSVKRIFRRARPDVAITGFAARAANPDQFSFPSGHSTVAFAIATAATGADPRLGAVEIALATLIAISRIVLGAHYPVDVIAGIALGFACGLVALAVV